MAGPLVIWRLPVMAESLPIIPWTMTGSKELLEEHTLLEIFRYALEGCEH